MHVHSLKRKLRFIIPVFLLVVLCFYVYSDLNLKNKEVIKVPDIVVSNIEVTREINGDNWHLKSPRVEHKDNRIFAQSLDIKVETKDSKEIYILADKGFFSRTDNNLELISADAKMLDQNKTYYLKSGKADYDSSKKIWLFDDSVTIFDSKTRANAETGSFDTQSGDCILSGGANILFEE